MQNPDSEPRTPVDLVRAAMNEREISGVQLARRLGITQAYLSRRLTGEVEFRISELQAIADELGVPVTQFVSDRPVAA